MSLTDGQPQALLNVKLNDTLISLRDGPCALVFVSKDSLFVQDKTNRISVYDLTGKSRGDLHQTLFRTIKDAEEYFHRFFGTSKPVVDDLFDRLNLKVGSYLIYQMSDSSGFKMHCVNQVMKPEGNRQVVRVNGVDMNFQLVVGRNTYAITRQEYMEARGHLDPYYCYTHQAVFTLWNSIAQEIANTAKNPFDPNFNRLVIMAGGFAICLVNDIQSTWKILTARSGIGDIFYINGNVRRYLAGRDVFAISSAEYHWINEAIELKETRRQELLDCIKSRIKTKPVKKQPKTDSAFRQEIKHGTHIIWMNTNDANDFRLYEVAVYDSLSKVIHTTSNNAFSLASPARIGKNVFAVNQEELEKINIIRKDFGDQAMLEFLQSLASKIYNSLHPKAKKKTEETKPAKVVKPTEMKKTSAPESHQDFNFDIGAKAAKLLSGKNKRK